MPRSATATTFVEELAEFLASRPSRKQLLDFRPSATVQRRARRLLLRLNAGESTYEEEQELDQYAHIERLMRLLKAKLRTRGPENE